MQTNSLSTHFKNSVVLDHDLSWLSADSFAAATRHAEKPESLKQPIPPKDSMPSKGMSTYLKNVRFNPYRSTRPELLAEINAFVNNGVRKLNGEFGDDIPNKDMVNLYGAAFQKYIDESTLYQSFLRSTKGYYEARLTELTAKVLSYQDFDRQLEDKELQHSNIRNEAQQVANLRIAELEAKLKKLQTSEQTLLAEVQRLSNENVRQVETTNLVKKELEASRNTCNALSNSLARMVDDKSKSDIVEAARYLETVQCRQTEQALSLEVDRLE